MNVPVKESSTRQESHVADEHSRNEPSSPTLVSFPPELELFTFSVVHQSIEESSTGHKSPTLVPSSPELEPLLIYVEPETPEAVGRAELE